MAPVRPSGHDNPRSVSLCNLRRQMPAPPVRRVIHQLSQQECQA